MIVDMRSLTEDDRLQGNSIPELKLGMERLAQRYGRQFKLQGRVLKAGPMLSVIALRFLMSSDEERRRVLGDWIPRLERLLEAEGTHDDVAAFLGRIEAPDPGAVKAAAGPGSVVTQGDWFPETGSRPQAGADRPPEQTPRRKQGR
jgi:hypothetical protein